MRYDNIKSLLIFQYSDEIESIICPVDPYSPNFNKNFIIHNVCNGKQEYDRILDIKKNEFVNSGIPFIIEYYLDKKLTKTIYQCNDVEMDEQDFLTFVDNYLLM